MSDSIGWIGTTTGRKVNLLDPQVETISLEDIAIGLSNVCRFCGQLDRHYSVAEHSICVAHSAYLTTGCPVIALQGLLHDASEAYMGDCPTPVKQLIMETWGPIEEGLQNAVFDKWDIPRLMHYEVKDADRRWCLTEKLSLQPSGPSWDGPRWDGVAPIAQGPLHPAAQHKIVERFFWNFNLFSDRCNQLADRKAIHA